MFTTSSLADWFKLTKMHIIPILFLFLLVNRYPLTPTYIPELLGGLTATIIVVAILTALYRTTKTMAKTGYQHLFKPN